MLMWDLPLSRRQDFHAQLPEALYSCEELIPRLGGAHTGRRACHDEIARLQGVILRKKCDLLGHAPDHLVDVRVLAKLAVYLEPELAFFRVPILRGGGNGPNRVRLVEILAEGPGPAFVFSDLLQIAPGHVQAHRVTPDVLAGFRRRDLMAACADDCDHLGLPVVMGRHRRIVHGAALGHQIVSRLGKEERLFAAVAAHLLLVLHIVAAHAEDAAHGKAGVRAYDRKRGDVPAADDVFHFHDERSSLNRKRSAAGTEWPGADEKGRIFSRTGGREALALIVTAQKKTGTRRCPFKDKPVSERLPAYDEYSNIRLVPLVTSSNLLAVQVDVQTLPLLFLGDAQADSQVDHFEDDETANAADEQRGNHAVKLGQEAGVGAADFLDVEHAREERADDAADTVHAERVQRVVVAEHLFH